MLDYAQLRLIKDNAGVKTVETVNSRLSPYPSLNDVNYVAYGDASIEHFNELYGYLEQIGELQNFFNGRTRTESHPREYLIRNVIHHPENTYNTYTEQELLKAIVDMRSFISSLS